MLLAAAGMALGWSQSALAAELLYFLAPSPETPKEQRRMLKDEEGDPIAMASEPVARLSSAHVQEARVVTEEVEVLDEDEPVSQLFRVVLVVDEPEAAKLQKTMDELCKTRPGVHIAFDDTVIDYRPFAVCGHFEPAVSFLDKPAAEKFANQFAKKVTMVTPASK
jgi:hypothetical protein